MKEIKAPRAISESSTTSDNTSEFIDIVKKYDVVYNTHNPDYKNVEVKMKVWSQIADEIGLSVEASKRKWKNLRDSYTKYLRSFRIGSKTSKKYQYWAHADHMEFLKPYQGPGRNSVNNNGKSNDEDDTECDLGYQVLAKTTTSNGEEDLKITITTNPTSSVFGNTTTVSSLTTAMSTGVQLAAPSPSTAAAIMPATISPCGSNGSCAIAPISALSALPPSASAVVLPLPALPTVPLPTAQLPPGSKPQTTFTSLGNLPVGLSLPPVASVSAPQIFPLAPLSAASVAKAAAAAAALPMPASSASSSVGCLIIEPQLFATADSFKKELNAPNAAAAALGIFHNFTSHGVSATATNCRTNPPLFTKIRRVQPSPQTAAINLSFSATGAGSANLSAAPPQPPQPKVRKICDRSGDLDITAVLQANRDLDANTLFFLSLARQVRAMPMKFQSLAKMRCMRIVSDIELELENVDCNGVQQEEGGNGAANVKYCSIDTPPPPQPQDGTGMIAVVNDAPTEHFLYVMSPSRVESMIDISSDDEGNVNTGN